MSGAPSSSEPLEHAAANLAPVRTDAGADAALVRAALGRLEAAVRDERAVLARLRGGLGEMAKAIAKAKAMADSATTVALLDEFEHRIDAMIEIAGGKAGRPHEAPQDVPAAEQLAAAAAEPAQVPTVSDVVSRLDSGVDETSPPAAIADSPVGAGNEFNVATLTALVQALRDSIPAAASTSEAIVEAAPPAPQANAPAAVAAATVPADPTFDPAGLFGPEPEPAALPPPEHRSRAAALPQPEFVSTPIEPAAPKPQAAPPADAGPAQPAPPAHDPLHALKAMSENERLALFS